MKISIICGAIAAAMLTYATAASAEIVRLRFQETPKASTTFKMCLA